MNVVPSAELAAVVGPGPFERQEVVKKVWEYIRKHKLQEAEDKRFIRADAKLRPVFGGRNRVSMFELTAFVSTHLESKAEAPRKAPSRGGGAVHIVVGSEVDHEGWEQCADEGEPVEWIVPKGAEPGDRIIFFFAWLGLIGEGVLSSKPEAAGNGRYTADVGQLVRYARPVQIAALIENAPTWGWPTYPRSYHTVPAEFLSVLDDQIAQAES